MKQQQYENAMRNAVAVLHQCAILMKQGDPNAINYVHRAQVLLENVMGDE